MSYFLIFTRPHITLLQLSHGSMSQFYNCPKSNLKIIAIFTPQNFIKFNFHTTICHFALIFPTPHITSFHLSHDHMSESSYLYTNTYYIIPISHYRKSFYSNCHTNKCHNFPMSIRPYVKLFQLSHDHFSYYSNFKKTICHILTTVPPPHITFCQISNYHISYYSKCQSPYITLFQLSNDHLSQISHCHTTT